MSASRGRRVELEPAYLLHQRDWRDSSRIIEFYARDHGRIALFAKGVRRPGSGLGAVLRPFVPMLLTWQGSGDGGTLVAAEAPEVTSLVAPACLMSGFYLNELLLKLLGREDPHPDVFEFYGTSLRQLQSPADERRVLRIFEKRFLDALGFGIDYAHCLATGDASLPGAFTYAGPLAVMSVDPIRGAISGGTFVTIRGTGFSSRPGLRVFFGADAATQVQVRSDSVLVAYNLANNGSEAQKRKYLPELCSGRMIGAFALTEPNCGSDATALRTRAVRDGDTWVLDGTKQWITNAKSAGLFLLFARFLPMIAISVIRCQAG